MRGIVLWLWVAPLLVQGVPRPFVVTNVIHTSGASSPVFQLPTWESSLSIFGVQADGDVHLHLRHLAHGLTLTISLEIHAYERESQVTGSGPLLDALSVVTQEDVDFSLDDFAWFSIVRSKDLVTVYKAGATQPFLLYLNNNTLNEASFLEFNSFQVSSVRNASWDFIGDKYEDENAATVPKDLKSELEGIVEGLQSRWRVIKAFENTTSVNKLKKSNIKELLSELFWMKSYAMVLNYFGYKLEGGNVTQLVVDANAMIYEAADVLRPVREIFTNQSTGRRLIQSTIQVT